MTFDRNSIRIWLQPWFLAGQVAKCHFGSSFGNLDLVQNHDHLVMLVTYTSGDTDRAAAAAAAAESLQSCPTLCDPIDGSPPGSPSLGFSRQEHWSGLPFPSPMHKVKSESEAAQSCPTLCDPMDCSLPGSSIRGVFRQEYWSGVPLPSPGHRV